MERWHSGIYIYQSPTHLSFDILFRAEKEIYAVKLFSARDYGAQRSGNDIDAITGSLTTGNLLVKVQVAKVDHIDIAMNCTESATVITASLASADGLSSSEEVSIRVTLIPDQTFLKFRAPKAGHRRFLAK